MSFKRFSLISNYTNMEFDEVELIVLFCITFLALFVFANTGLGPGMIMQIGYWSMAALGLVDEAKLSTVLVYLSFSKYPMGMIQSIIKRKYILFQIHYAIILIITVFISTFIGIFILVRYQSPTLVRILGGLLLISLIITFLKQCLFQSNNKQIITNDIQYNEQTPILNDKILKRYNRYNIDKNIVFYDLNSWQRYFGLILTSILSGFSRGLYGVGGPPFIVYQLITDFDRNSFRSLMAFADGFGSGLMTMIYLLFIEKKFDPSQWEIYLIVFIAAISGLLIGNMCAKYVDQQSFKITMQFLLFCGSINLMLVNLGTISVYASAGLAILFVIVMFALLCRLCIIHNRRKEFDVV
eukprot:335191_1